MLKVAWSKGMGVRLGKLPMTLRHFDLVFVNGGNLYMMCCSTLGQHKSGLSGYSTYIERVCLGQIALSYVQATGRASP
jgi:hypothetical protein